MKCEAYVNPDALLGLWLEDAWVSQFYFFV